MSSNHSKGQNFSREEAYLKVFNHSCTVCLLENGRAAAFRTVSNHSALFACGPQRWPSNIRQVGASDQSAHQLNIQKAPPSSSHIQGRSISHRSRIFMQTERKENETRLPSWHWFIPLTVWCHCIVSPLNLLVLVLPGRKWSKTIPGCRCDIHISVGWGYIF